jgi:hypothetical protein
MHLTFLSRLHSHLKHFHEGPVPDFAHTCQAGVDWHSSKLGESQEVFAKRLIVQIDKDQIELNESNGVTNGTEDVSTIPWTLRTDSNRGMSGVKLNHSATQKDWVKLKSYQLTESFCIAVVGHKGWEKDIRKSIPYSIAVSFEALNKDLEIYEDIRVHNEVEFES